MTVAIIFLLAPVFAWVLVAVTGPFSKVVDDLDANGRNWPGFFIVHRQAPHLAAVFAQEFYEAQRKMRRPWELPLRSIGMLNPKWDFIGRRMEIMGHEIEVQAAWRVYGVDRHDKRISEARALIGYRQFEGYSTREIMDLMRARSDVARKWLDGHYHEIDEFYRETRT